MPSKLPEADLKRYSVDLDDTTGIHHVTLRKVSLRTTLLSTDLSNPNFFRHVVEFSNGEMTAMPRSNCAATNSERKARKIPARDYQWDSSIAQPRPVRDVVRQIQFGSFGQDIEVNTQVANNKPNIAESSMSKSHEVISNGTISAPTGTDSSIMVSGRVVGQQTANALSRIPNFSESVIHIVPRNEKTTTAIEGDSSITGSGRIVGRQAADEQSSLANFSKSIFHIVPRNAMVSTSLEAEVSDAAAQAQEPVQPAVDIQTSDDSSPSRRSSAGSQGSGTSTSTVPTTSSTFSSLSFWKSALANLPEMPIAPGKPSHVIKALALEEPKHNALRKTDDQDKTLVRRLSWDLSISRRQLIHWDEIQEGRPPCLEETSVPRNGLAITDEGQIVLAEEVSTNVHCSFTSPRLTSKPVEALPSSYADSTYLFDALDVVRIELVGQKFSPLFALDLVPEVKGKQRATDAAKNRQFPPICDETDVEIDIDGPSGELYLRPTTTVPTLISQSIPAATGTNVATGGGVPIQDQPSSDGGEQPTRFENIDLTAESNQGATDLDDEETYAAPSVIASHTIGTYLAQTQYIPSEYADHVEYMMQSQPFVPRVEVEANEYWNFIKANIHRTWYAQGCPKRFLPRPPPCENDSDAVFRELLGLGDKVRALVESPPDLRVGTLVHHYNLINQPVFQESRNPSAVSYWAAMASHWKEQISDGISWKAVVSSQAAKWVDPCTLDGGVAIPDDLRARENSTALRNFLTGQTTIRYEPWGTWMSDGYDPDQEIPEVMDTEFHEAFLNSSSAANMFRGLQRPYFIRPQDRDNNVNDDGTATFYPYLITKEEQGWETLESRGSTNLRLVHDGTGLVYSLKGMKESRVWEVLKKYETTNILLIGLPFEAKPNNAVEELSNEAEAALKAEPKNVTEENSNEADANIKAEPKTAIEQISNETDADEIKDDTSEAETDIPDDVVFEREPVHYQGTLQITEGLAASESCEGAPKQIEPCGSDLPEVESRDDAIVNEEAAAEQGPIPQANTCTDLVVSTSPAIEESVEPLEEPEAKEPAKIESTKLPEYIADTTLDVGKGMMNDIKAQSYENVSKIDDDGNNNNNEDSDYESIAGAGFDDTDYSSTWAKHPKPEDHPKANELARFAENTPRLFPKSTNSSQGPEVASKLQQSQKKGSSQEAGVHSQSKHIKARFRLASWSSCPGRVMRGECDHTYTFDAETEDIERHPDLGRNSVDMIQDYAEAFNEAYTPERNEVNPEYDECITKLLGSGALAQMMKSGQGSIPCVGRMMTLLGPGIVEKMMEGYDTPCATTGMVTFLGTGPVPYIEYKSRATSDEMMILPSNSVDGAMSGRDSPPSTTDSTDTRESPIQSGRNLSPTKMLSSVMGQPETPAQSPEAAENLGVWEDDGNGGFESPCKHRPQYVAKDVNGQGDQFDDDVDIFDSATEEAPAAAQAAFHKVMVLADVTDRATNFEDEGAPSTPVRPKFGVLSPIQENSQTPVQRFRAPTGSRNSGNPNFMWASSQTRFPARKQTLGLADLAAQKPLSAESSKIHSRNSSSSSSEAISTENGNTHTRNTSVTTVSSSSEAVSTENGSTHTRNTSLSEAMSLEEEFNEERAMWEVEKRKGYAASRMAQFDSPVKVPVVLEAAAFEGALASPSMQHEAKGDVEETADPLVEEVEDEVAEYVLDGSSEEAPLPLPFDYYEGEAPSVEAQKEQDETIENAVEASSDNFVAHTSHYLLFVAIIVAFLWPFA